MRNESDIIRILDSEEKNKVDKIFDNFLEESDFKKINTFLQSKKVEERRKIFNEYNENKDYEYCLDTDEVLSMKRTRLKERRDLFKKLLESKNLESVFVCDSIEILKNIRNQINFDNDGDYSGYIKASINRYIESIIAKIIGYSKKRKETTQDTTPDNNSVNDNSQGEVDENMNASEQIRKTLQYDENKKLPLQTIFYGSPGCGKSFKVKEILAIVDEANIFRTTFHPDCDYYSFVGAYKPKKDPNTGSITYDFSPQVFTKAYIKAWENMLNPQNEEDGVQFVKPVVLVIEEINRGNCAQIFGDLFQLLDRDNNGYSEYPIKADEDLMSYVKTNCNNPAAYSNDELRLPPNLYIVATMNTSDQSLFPMDSAFKRRWAWKYVPIDYNNQDSYGFNITIDGNAYRWHEFLKKINDKIYEVTNSEDKMLGNFFIKSSIDEEDFVDKIMFYLWNDVLKLEYASGNDYFFKKEDDSKFKFSDLYDSNTRTSTLESFMKYLGLKFIVL